MKSFITALVLASIVGIPSASADWKLGQRPTMDEREQYETYHLRKGNHEAGTKSDEARKAGRNINSFGGVPATQPSLHPDFTDLERSPGRS